MVGVGEEFRWCIYNGWFKVGRGGNCKGEGGMGELQKGREVGGLKREKLLGGPYGKGGVRQNGGGGIV